MGVFADVAISIILAFIVWAVVYLTLLSPAARKGWGWQTSGVLGGVYGGDGVVSDDPDATAPLSSFDARLTLTTQSAPAEGRPIAIAGTPSLNGRGLAFEGNQTYRFPARVMALKADGSEDTDPSAAVLYDVYMTSSADTLYVRVPAELKGNTTYVFYSHIANMPAAWVAPASASAAVQNFTPSPTEAAATAAANASA